MLLPNHFLALSKLILSLYNLQIIDLFSFFQDKMLQPHELEELFSSAPKR
jgi:hypothetical protein